MTLADDVRSRRGDPDDPFDQEAARREYSRSARRRERARADEHARARKAGRAGGGRSEFEDDPELLSSYDEGARSTSSSSGGRSVSMPKLDVVSDGSGVLLGAIVYVLVLNYIRGGPQAVRGWFSAKFLNRPYQPAAPLTPLTPAAPNQPTFGGPLPTNPLNGIAGGFGAGAGIGSTPVTRWGEPS